ncbi:MAG: hypothetical protein IKI66_09030 [Bacteroidales bacterium]|nr:hypothetical protein [Bacteroidales bacterium]
MKTFDVLKCLLFHGYFNVHETGRNSIWNQAAEELERELADAESRPLRVRGLKHIGGFSRTFVYVLKKINSRSSNHFSLFFFLGIIA